MRPHLTTDACERLARDYVQAFDARDVAALKRLNAHYERSYTFEDLAAEIWRRVYAFRQRSARVPTNYLQLDEAQTLIARASGFSSWAALLEAADTGASPVPPYFVDAADGRIGPRRYLTPHEWDDLLAVMCSDRITALDASGLMTDDVLARIAALEHVTALSLGGSRQLTDDGLQYLARMPQLERLDLSEYPGGVLTDRGVAHLRACDRLEHVNLAFPALRELTPIDVRDDGFRHVGRCERLERLTCMYCRDTTDKATAHIADLQLRDYYAGLTQITDRSLALLGQMTSLEQVEFYECAHVTDAGLPFLARLPRLREVALDSVPGVSLEGTGVFPGHVRVRYTT